MTETRTCRCEWLGLIIYSQFVPTARPALLLKGFNTVAAVGGSLANPRPLLGRRLRLWLRPRLKLDTLEARQQAAVAHRCEPRDHLGSWLLRVGLRPGKDSSLQAAQATGFLSSVWVQGIPR